MRPIRLVVLLLALAAVFAPPALADPGSTNGLCLFDASRSSDHFVVHWTSDTTCDDERIFEPQAGEILAIAETAYAGIVTSWGFKTPFDDGNGKTDIYVYLVETPAGDPVDISYGSGDFSIPPSNADDRMIISSGVFRDVSLAYSLVDQEWLMFGSAFWAGLRANDFADAELSWLEVPDIALDCYGDACDKELSKNTGSARWPFFVYLQDRFGTNAVRQVWEKVDARDAATPDGVGALEDYLADKGTTLATFFNDFAGAVANGSLSAAPLKGKRPVLAGTITTGAAAAALAPLKVGVNHLSARFVEVVPGTGKLEPCHPATLTVTVDIPAGVAAKPKWAYTGPGGGLASFTVAGSKATYSRAWDTCTWKDGRRGIVSLPHPGTSGDGKEFKVTATVSAINTSVVLSPDAPTPVADPRPNEGTPEAAPPVLSLHAPAVIRVAKSRRLTLHLHASHEGFVRLTLDGRSLGSVAVRTGQNVLRLKLPKPKTPSRRVLQRSSLSLTALSASGETGGTVSRRLVVAR